jgi:hypothetical protein
MDCRCPFIHPLSDPTLGRQIISNWAQLLESPPVRLEENLCRAGGFPANCLKYGHEDDPHKPWRTLNDSVIKNGDMVSVAERPDKPGNFALTIEKTDQASAAQEIGCYQWLSRAPEKQGTVVVMRFRVRAASGDGRMSVRMQLPLALPAGSQSREVVRLRNLSTPQEIDTPKPEEETRRIVIEDWITPTQEWQTYYVVWDWPPYCQQPYHRNVVVQYMGIGKIWVDNVEVFSWEPGGVK